MTSPELSEHQIQYLAWKLAASLLSQLEATYGKLVLADLHPGGGPYDCLSLITSDARPLVLLNRAGTSAQIAGKTIGDIWSRTYEMGASDTAEYLLAKAGIASSTHHQPIKNELTTTCLRVARWIRSNSEENRKPTCCWVDDTYSVGPNSAILSMGSIPESWKLLAPPYNGTDWSAWIFAMTSMKGIDGFVNMKTGEAILPNGQIWDSWNEKLAIEPKSKKQRESARKISLPPVSINEEALNSFRALGSFNGYEVFGEKLKDIANQVAEQWFANQTLPSDIDEIRGALFFAFRQSRFIDGYPSDDDLPYLQALADKIRNN